MTQIKLRRDTSANFTSANPVLGVGEPAYETDTKKLKIGDGTTAYTQLEYFSTGGGGSANIGAVLPLKIVDGVISLEVDGQTIQIVDGKLHANIDELGNEVNTLAGDVAGVQTDLLNKQDKFETQVPLSISSSSITTSVPAGITETTESWSGGGPDNLITVNLSALNIDANSDWKIHLSGYMGDFRATMTNTNVLLISAEKNTIFRVWFGSADFRLGNGVIGFKNIPDSNREFFYEIVHQRNSTEFTFNGTDLVDSSPLSISKMSGAIGSGTYTTLAGQGKLKDISFVINSYQFQRIDRDITKSYFEADGVKYRFTSVAGTNTLNLNIGSGLSVVDGKLVNTNPTAYNLPTASSSVVGGIKVGDNLSITADGTLSATGGGGSAPANMVTTDTTQTITGLKTFGGTDLSKMLLEGSESLINFRQNSDSLPTTLIGGFFDSNGKKSITIGSTDHETLSLNAKNVQDGSGNKFLTSGNVTAYITETYVNGTSGYRLYSDKYIEQWGYKSGTNSETITFLKAFKDTNYNVVMATESARVYYQGDYGNKTTTSMEIGYTGGSGGTALGVSWRVAGYIA